MKFQDKIKMKLLFFYFFRINFLNKQFDLMRRFATGEFLPKQLISTKKTALPMAKRFLNMMWFFCYSSTFEKFMAA